MRKHIIPILIFGGIFAVLAFTALRHTSATLNDKAYALANGVLSVVTFALAVVSGAIAAYKRRTVIRDYSIGIAMAAGLIATIPFAGSAHRMNVTTSYLSDTYAVLAKNGPPFPSELPAATDTSENALISHGYWVASDQQAFEVYYHDGSDSFTMVYPTGRWEWRGNKYSGPEDSPK